MILSLCCSSLSINFLLIELLFMSSSHSTQLGWGQTNDNLQKSLSETILPGLNTHNISAVYKLQLEKSALRTIWIFVINVTKQQRPFGTGSYIKYRNWHILLIRYLNYRFQHGQKMKITLVSTAVTG